MHEEILFTPILGAHLLAGIGALTLAIVQVHFMSRGSKDHKKLGWVWAALMAFLAVSSLWDLLGNGLLSIPAHVFTLATVIFLPLAIWAARTHRVVLHRNAMIALYVVLIAAFAALVAVLGRLFNQWFLG